MTEGQHDPWNAGPCRTCGFTDCPGATIRECPRWPGRDYARRPPAYPLEGILEYDRPIIGRARGYAERDASPDDLRGVVPCTSADTPDNLVYAAATGAFHQVIKDLLRILDDITGQDDR